MQIASHFDRICPMDVSNLLRLCRTGGITRVQDDAAFLRVFTTPCSEIINPPAGMRRIREEDVQLFQEKIKEGCPICQNGEELTEETCLIINCPGKHQICSTCAKSWFERKQECPLRCQVSFTQRYNQYLRSQYTFNGGDIVAYLNQLRDGGFNFNDPVEGEPVLIHAIKNGRSRLTNYLIQNLGADPNITDSRGLPAIFHLFDIDNPDAQVLVFTTLLSHGVNINVRDLEGIPFIIQVVRRSLIEIVNALVSISFQNRLDTEVACPDGYTIFGSTALNTDNYILPYISIFECDSFLGNTISGDSTIQIAIEEAQTTLDFNGFVDVLLEYCSGGDYQYTQNNKGHTDIITCARKNKPEYLSFLFTKIAESTDFSSDWINDEDNKGQTALFAACKRGHLECARLLIEKGANTLTRNSQGVSAHQIALDRGYHEVAQLLEENLSIPEVSF